jgi:hypothetical protein
MFAFRTARGSGRGQEGSKEGPFSSPCYSRGDGDEDVIDKETLAACRIRKSLSYVCESYRFSLTIVNARARMLGVG